MYKILLLLLLIPCIAYADDITCSQKGTEIKCIVEYVPTEADYMRKYNAIGTIKVVKIIVLEVAKSATVELIKDAIIRKYKELYIDRPVPKNIQLLIGHDNDRKMGKTDFINYTTSR